MIDFHTEKAFCFSTDQTIIFTDLEQYTLEDNLLLLMTRYLFRGWTHRIFSFRSQQQRLIVLGIFLVCLLLIEINHSGSFNIFKSRLQKPVRICCLILTTPEFFHNRTQAVHETWAPRCDRHFFVSEVTQKNLTDEEKELEKRFAIAPIFHGESGYGNLTQRTSLAFQYAYRNYFNDFDWFLKADDDTYIIVENLREFLSDKDPSQPVTFGYNFKTLIPGGYHSGGASYVLSRESLKRFYHAHQIPNNTFCQPIYGVEDLEIAKCLREQGVYMGKSLDKYNRELFHPLTFQKHFLGTYPAWLPQYAENPVQIHYNCCSDRSISFHYVKPVEQYLIDFFLYRVRMRK